MRTIPFHAIASNPDIINNAVIAGLKPIEEGVATGVSAILLVKASNRQASGYFA
jgi:predicted ATP-grasp superfamily ATP-dependent carboligase